MTDFNPMYSFGTYINFKVKLAEGGCIVSPESDAASAVLATLVRLSPSARNTAYKNVARIIKFIQNVEVLEVLQPFRLLNVINILFSFLTLQMEKCVYTYLV